MLPIANPSLLGHTDSDILQVIGPICGGFIGQRIGWRWVFWILLIAASVVTISIEIFNKETNPRVLMQRKVKRLQKDLGRSDLRSCYDGSGPRQTSSQILRHGIVRPLKMLFLSPIILLLSTYMAVVYGLLYLLFTTITTVFIETYHWQPDICGLAYIGLGIGFLTGLGVVAKISDATVVRMTKANNGIFEPEMRLPACIFFACFVPITFFWYGWSADKGVHWIVPIIGLIPFGFGMMGIFIPIQTYTIDSFPQFAASVSLPSPSLVPCSVRSCLWPAHLCMLHLVSDGVILYWGLLLLA